MDINDQTSHQSTSAKAVSAGGDRIKEIGNGFRWWRPARPSLADLSSNTSTASTSVVSTSSPPQRPHDKHGGGGGSYRSANRLLFDGPASAASVVTGTATAGEGEGGGGILEQQFETQQKPSKRHQKQSQPADGRHLWTKGSRDGTEAPSPEEDYVDSADRGRNTTAASPTPLLLSEYNNGESTRRRRPEQEDLPAERSSSKPRTAVKLATIEVLPSQGCKSSGQASGTLSQVGVGVGGGSDDGGDNGGGNRGRHEQHRRLQLKEDERRTPSKPPRPQEQEASSRATSVSKVSVMESGEKHGTEEVEPTAAGGGDDDNGSSCAVRKGLAKVCNDKSEGAGAGAQGMACDARGKTVPGSRCHGSGMDDETATRVNTAKKPSLVYDILAVDRGGGFCDTSVVPFQVEEGGYVAAERLRGLTSGQSEFLARRGFATGLVSHFLEETNSEFRALQGGESSGMNAAQLAEAAVRLEEAFVPAVKRLRERASMEVVLDSLFQGTDHAGDFVVRFEVTITRCHPEDIESSPTLALRECARAVREAVSEEGVAEQSVHEVVFVGRPMWELVSPVLDLSPRVGDNDASTSG